MTDEATRKESWRQQAVFWAIVIGLVALCMFVPRLLARTWYDGSFVGAVLVGGRLLVGEHVYVSGNSETVTYDRLVQLDASTGAELGRASIGTADGCQAFGADGLVCGGWDELQHVSVPSLRVTDLEAVAAAAGFDLDYDGRPALRADPVSVPAGSPPERAYVRALDGRWLAVGPGPVVAAVTEPANTRDFGWIEHRLDSGRPGPSDLINSRVFTEGLPARHAWTTYRQAMNRDAPAWLLVQVDGRETARIELGSPGSIRSVLPWEGGVLACVEHADGTRVLSVGPDGRLRWQVRI